MSNSTELIRLNQMNIFNELSELIALRIHSCNESNHPKYWVESKLHNDYDLWLVREGQIDISINGKIHQAKEGDLILFSPKVAYTASTTTEQGCRFVFTHFDFGLGDHLRILDHFQLTGVIPGSLADKECQLFWDAYLQNKQGAGMSALRLKGCFTLLISKIMEKYERGEYRGEFMNSTHEGNRTKSLHFLQPVLNFIHEHLHQSIRNHELAALAGMSEKYFILYFKQTIGITPGQYIYQLKMNRARELLYSKRYSVQQIAGKLGYPDPYTFSKSFKKYYKVPPSQFV